MQEVLRRPVHGDGAPGHGAEVSGGRVPEPGDDIQRHPRAHGRVERDDLAREPQPAIWAGRLRHRLRAAQGRGRGMSAYAALAEFYDELTRDVPYRAFADYYERLFKEYTIEVGLVLDLCCGTGSLACEMSGRGYEIIAADASADMLMCARDKAWSRGLGKMPLFINQSAQELDLYGTVDAAYSSLDSLSYMPFDDLPEVFGRLRLFVRPGGLLVFDLRTPEFLRSMDGSVSVDETDGVFCLWRGRFDRRVGFRKRIGQGEQLKIIKLSVFERGLRRFCECLVFNEIF